MEIKNLELIGKRRFNKSYVFDSELFSYESYLCFFSARIYYKYGKKFIVAELNHYLFDYDSVTIGRFYDVTFYDDNVLYYGITSITEIYSNDSVSDLQFNSIYDFKELPEVKKKKQKKGGYYK